MGDVTPDSAHPNPSSRQTIDPATVPMNLLCSDRFLDRVLDLLADRAELIDGLARWDLKHALITTISEVYKP